MLRLRALVALCSLFATLTASAAANPMGISWRLSTNAGAFGKPTGMLIAGRCNRYDPAFQAARAKGAELLAYINPINRPDNYICKASVDFYMGDLGSVPLWPYPTYGQRTIFANTRMTDMRAGSEWVRWVVSYVGNLMREGKVDGVFLDNVGARSWMPLSNWSNWPQWEKDAYTNGNIDLVKRLDALRRQINPNFIIVNNSVWHRGDGTTMGSAGERYVDGVSIEHPKAQADWVKKYAAKSFSNLGHKRVLVIANTVTEAKYWAKIPGITHVSDQPTDRYAYPSPPQIPFVALYDR